MITTEDDQIAVLGAGIAGLTTAHMLLDEGLRVRVYTNTRHLHATSHVACAIWLPTASEVSVIGVQTIGWGLVGRTVFEKFLTPEWGVFRGQALEFFEDSSEITADWIECFPNAKQQTLPPSLSPWKVALNFETLYIDTPIYMPRLVEELTQRGCEFVAREFQEVGELEELPEKRIVNCLGAASATLFEDAELRLVAGQTLLFDDIRVPVGVGFGEYCVYPRTRGTLVGALAQVTASAYASPSESLYLQLCNMLDSYASGLDSCIGD